MNDNGIDPTQRVYPLRKTKCYHILPTCHINWTPEDGEKVAFYTEEPEFIQCGMLTYKACGRNHKGVLLYSIVT